MDIAIVVVYLFVILLVGLRRGYRTNNIRDFAVGDKNFGFPVLLATISATYIGGGSTLGDTERIYTMGILYAIVCIAYSSLFKFIITFVITPKFKNLQKHISFGEVMGEYYGENAKIISGLFGTLRCIGTLGSQTVGLGFIFHFFLGTSFELAVIFSAGILVLYTAFGGIRAVAATDFIQFFSLIIGIVVIANCALIAVGGYEALWKNLPESKTVIFSDSALFWENVSMFFILSAPFLNPAHIQRLLLSNDIRKTQKSMFYSFLMDPVFFFLIACIGLSSIILFPAVDPRLAMLTLIKEVIPSPFLKGICLAGLISVIMSTADSYLNSATVAFFNDFILPIRKKNFTPLTEMWLVRAITLFIGISSIFVALYFRNLIDIVIAFTSFWGTFMFIPFMAGLYNLKASSKSFWASTILGIPSFLIWAHYFQSQTHIRAIVPGLIMSSIGFFSIYFIERMSGKIRREKRTFTERDVIKKKKVWLSPTHNCSL
ncbi:MAG: sodium:solute symporter family protein [Myxococcales bacterium]|nr:sodium:solute symporter family protein [Myxococcales bacterium]USN50476.1 MAG: sodium:solute symporter family protein [Myxococcales bacterium]